MEHRALPTAGARLAPAGGVGLRRQGPMEVGGTNRGAHSDVALALVLGRTLGTGRTSGDFHPAPTVDLHFGTLGIARRLLLARHGFVGHGDTPQCRPMPRRSSE